ncbi:tail tape measure protein [Pseudomonas syringae]|nr:tail tape measure protein [Pseudomonas syringae]MBD8801897.1 tail tape measure protein [Pseudomonas syringae]MBD8811753.1 tail tape measure protein [Pseudomonas syringae]
MASKSLGTLTLDLIAKVGGFTGPLDQASRQAKGKTAEISQAFSGLAKGIAASVAAVPAILAGVVTSTVSTAKEVSNLAALAGLNTTEFQKYAAGAKSVGVEQDKLSDILKDTNDKLGDFFNTGGGALKDFFDNIAPKVGVTADQFKKLNSAEALQLYVSSLEKANASQAEMTFYMEAIASDSTALIPLLRNGGKEFKELGDAAAAAGAILDVKTIAVSKEFSGELIKLSQNLEGAKNTIAEGVMPVLAQFTKDMNETVKASGGLNTKIKELSATLLSVSAFVVNAGDGVVRIFRIVAETLVGMYATAVGYTSKLMSEVALALSQASFGETSKQLLADSKILADESALNFSVAAQAAATLKEQIETPLAGDRLKEYVAEAFKAADAIAKLSDEKPKLGTGTGVDPAAAEKAKKQAEEAAAAAKKAASDREAEAKRLNDAFKSSETDYLRQIELINTTADKRKDATEVAKVQFEIEKGGLVGINSEQQRRLKDLAAELDVKNQLKLLAEDQVKIDAFAAAQQTGLDATKAGFDLELSGAGQSNLMKEKLKANLQIQQQYVQDLKDLQEQQNTGELSQFAYERETEILEENLEKRIKLQEEYYEREDELRGDWLVGVSEAWENYAEMASNYSQIANDFVTDQLGTLQTSFGDAIYAMIMENQSLSESFQNVVSSMVSSLVRGLADMLAQWLIHQALKLIISQTGDAAAITAATATGTAIATAYAPAAALASLASFGANSIPASIGILSTTAVAEGVALAGMAHDGIDSVPEDGTWLLQKGERVVTSQTSAKLDATLARINEAQNMPARGGRKQGSNITLNQTNNFGAPDNRTANQTAAANTRKMRRASRLS